MIEIEHARASAHAHAVAAAQQQPAQPPESGVAGVVAAGAAAGHESAPVGFCRGAGAEAAGLCRAAFVFDRRDSDLFHLLQDTIRQHNAVVLGAAQPQPACSGSGCGGGSQGGEAAAASPCGEGERPVAHEPVCVGGGLEASSNPLASARLSSARASLAAAPAAAAQAGAAAAAGGSPSCSGAQAKAGGQRSSFNAAAAIQRPLLVAAGHAAAAAAAAAGSASHLAGTPRHAAAPHGGKQGAATRAAAAAAAAARRRALRFADGASSCGSSDADSEDEPTAADLRLDEALAQYEGVTLDTHLLQVGAGGRRFSAWFGGGRGASALLCWVAWG